MKHTLSVTFLQYSQCSFVSLAEEFINSLNWHKSLFDGFHNRCYCASCYPIYWDNVISTGGADYVMPRGWIRLRFRADPIHGDEHDIWNKWIGTFHGTIKTTTRSILTHRHFYLPSDKLINGTTEYQR